MPNIRMLLLAIFIFPLQVSAQEFDKKAFCTTLQAAMTALETSTDSLKGEYVGENSFGIQQWKSKITLYGALAGYYEDSGYLSTEFRATYIMREQSGKAEAAAIYKQLVSATRACYGADFLLEEKVSTEYRAGKKVEQLEAIFTRTVEGRSTGVSYPYIRISSTSYETGETFEVLIELIRF